MTFPGEAAAVAALPLWKGHGTENDFLVLDDRDDTVVLTPAIVRALCDRRAGIGADGVLRVVAQHEAVSAARYFMDYRNADGSLAEMCGNGARVFARYLQRAGLETGASFTIGSRAGDVPAELHDDGLVTVSVGPVTVLDRAATVCADGLGELLTGRAVTMPNPHVVVTLADEKQLAALDLSRAPVVEQPLPEGQNVEFVVHLGERHMSLRVHERGSGETRSCGTGIAAAVVAAETSDGRSPSGQRWRVDVPGGTVWASWAGRDRVELTGPAVLVARVELDVAWLSRALNPPA
jgi:diaminopimelate epimerase